MQRPWMVAGMCVAGALALQPSLSRDALRHATEMATTVTTAATGRAPGYLATDKLPDGVKLLPPPPAAGSPEQARDQAASDGALAVIKANPARWAQARADAVLDFPAAAHAFDCALGVAIDERATPVTYRMLRRTVADFGGATRTAKAFYHRPRPFMINGRPICTPEDDAGLRKNGAYPSGHSAIGYGWGLVLAAIAPERRRALVLRGADFGDSRRYCNVHWASDVAAGQSIATTTFDSLQADPAFNRDLAAARREIAAVRSAGTSAPAGCPATD